MDLELVSIEWNTLILRWRKGFQEAENSTLGAMNVSYGFIDPFSTFTRFFHSGSQPPKSQNIMPYVNAEVDRLIERRQNWSLTSQSKMLSWHRCMRSSWKMLRGFLLCTTSTARPEPKEGYVQAQSVSGSNAGVGGETSPETRIRGILKAPSWSTEAGWKEVEKESTLCREMFMPEADGQACMW